MNKNKLLSVMLAVILIISMTSCEKTQQIPFEEPEETILHTNVYEIVPLPVIEENICSTYLDRESIYFTVRTENEDKYSFITCDWNGEIQSEVPVVPFPYFLIRQYASLAENTVVFIHMGENYG